MPQQDEGAIERDGRYGACASKIYLKFEEGVLDAAGIAVCPDGLSIGRGRLERGERYDREEEVFFGSGCCIMCRREMLEDVRVGDDYFDEAFFMYADDTDLGWRAALRGWRCIYAPDARVYHLHSASLESYSPLKAFLVERNRIWLQVKYFPFRMMLYGQFFTALRYLFQAYGALAGRGASGGFSREHSKGELVVILFQGVGRRAQGPARRLEETEDHPEEADDQHRPDMQAREGVRDQGAGDCDEGVGTGRFAKRPAGREATLIARWQARKNRHLTCCATVNRPKLRFDWWRRYRIVFSGRNSTVP